MTARRYVLSARVDGSNNGCGASTAALLAARGRTERRAGADHAPQASELEPRPTFRALAEPTTELSVGRWHGPTGVTPRLAPSPNEPTSPKPHIDSGQAGRPSSAMGTMADSGRRRTGRRTPRRRMLRSSSRSDTPDPGRCRSWRSRTTRSRVPAPGLCTPNRRRDGRTRAEGSSSTNRRARRARLRRAWRHRVTAPSNTAKSVAATRQLDTRRAQPWLAATPGTAR